MADRVIDSAVPLPPDVAGGAQPVGAVDSTSTPHIVQGRFAHGDEGYYALVWRRFRRSAGGMIGLVLVCGLLLMSVFADFFAPMDPKGQTLSFAPPDAIQFQAPDGSFSL